MRTRGFALARKDDRLAARDLVGARRASPAAAATSLASSEPAAHWRELAQRLFAAGECAEYLDDPHGIYRVAAFADGRLDGALFIGAPDAAPQWDAVRALFEAEAVSEADRRILLSGRNADGLAEAGPLVCACFGVGLNVIRDALASGAAASVEEIGQALRAGTNCGSCLPELKRIVARDRAEAAV